MQVTWQPLSSHAEAELIDARLRLHWAVQVVASFGLSLVAPRPDWSHASVIWSARVGGFVGEPDFSGLQLALAPESLELLATRSESVIDRFHLSGHTLQEAYRWTDRVVASQRPGTDSALALVLPEHELPDHEVSHGSIFGDPGEAERVVAAWFANAALVLERVRRSEDGASAVRCWPHHFDIATLISLDEDGGESARSIGVGLSPGDSTHPLPYFYVTPWPYPDIAALPDPPSGAQWHTAGWVGLVLPAEAVMAGRDKSQERLVDNVLQHGVSACRSLLATSSS